MMIEKMQESKSGGIMPEFLDAAESLAEPIVYDIVKDEIWIVDNFFSEDQCNKLIEISERCGYIQAMVTVGEGIGVIDKGYRDSKRVMIDDFEFAKYLHQKCLPYLPLAYEGGLLQGLNERFRFLKYDEPGNKFKVHIDSAYYKNDSEKTNITVQFYLAEKMEGGATTFFHPKFPDKKFACHPKTGRAVFFRHEAWLHEGSEMISGLKYTIRDDVMYKWFNNEALKSFEGVECKKCGSKTKLLELASCKHKLIVCGCIPFNFFCPSTRGVIMGRCFQCDKKIKLKEKDEKEYVKAAEESLLDLKDSKYLNVF